MAHGGPDGRAHAAGECVDDCPRRGRLTRMVGTPLQSWGSSSVSTRPVGVRKALGLHRTQHLLSSSASPCRAREHAIATPDGPPGLGSRPVGGGAPPSAGRAGGAAATVTAGDLVAREEGARQEQYAYTSGTGTGPPPHGGRRATGVPSIIDPTPLHAARLGAWVAKRGRCRQTLRVHGDVEVSSAQQVSRSWGPAAYRGCIQVPR